MTKQELYRDLCIEAGTHDGATDANAWYDACSHNVTSGMDGTFGAAAGGDVEAIAEARSLCGLPVLA